MLINLVICCIQICVYIMSFLVHVLMSMAIITRYSQFTCAFELFSMKAAPFVVNASEKEIGRLCSIMSGRYGK
ncbi:hypothetical protein QVD17_05700 [Tagetes erecta]|uniref:Uncharacterized protein n=1 Tax=Tagetes erecta TaxID=13708 RepID=A0AAD8PBQ9_TARER|nr:hypothetical protein QVD17_05700 [Tagetes erecta]